MLGVIQGRREGGRRGVIPRACPSFGGNWHVRGRWGPPGQSHICWWGQMRERARHLGTWPGGGLGGREIQ